MKFSDILTESELAELTRRDFLKGAGAAAVIGATSAVSAAPFKHGTFRDQMTGQTQGKYSTVKSDNSNAVLEIRWPGTNQSGFVIDIPGGVIDRSRYGAGARIKIGNKVEEIYLNPLSDSDFSSAGVLDDSIARRILTTPGELLIEIPIYRKGKQIYRFTIQPDIISKTAGA